MGKYITLKWRNNIKSINTDEIIYIESYNRHLCVYSIKGKTEVVGKLSEIINDLPMNEFLNIHKSFVVNMNFIDEINSDGAVINPELILPIRVRKKSLSLSKFNLFCEERGNKK